MLDAWATSPSSSSSSSCVIMCEQPRQVDFCVYKTMRHSSVETTTKTAVPTQAGAANWCRWSSRLPMMRSNANATKTAAAAAAAQQHLQSKTRRNDNTDGRHRAKQSNTSEAATQTKRLEQTTTISKRATSNKATKQQRPQRTNSDGRLLAFAVESSKPSNLRSPFEL